MSTGIKNMFGWCGHFFFRVTDFFDSTVKWIFLFMELEDIITKMELGRRKKILKLESGEDGNQHV